MPSLQVLSDLHFEFHRDGGAAFVDSLDPKGVDVLVVAGDLASAKLIEEALGRVCDRFAEVVFVAGNHEYYGGSPKRTGAVIARAVARHRNLHWLDESAAVVAGVRFVGTSLWFSDSPEGRLLRGQLNDFRVISDFEPWVYEKNARAREFLEAEVGAGDVVVTHHLPSPRSVHPKYQGDPLNRFFVCDVEGLMAAREPGLWIHGHTHEQVDYQVGRTRVVANPFGYLRHESQAGFRERLLIEVPAVNGTVGSRRG